MNEESERACSDLTDSPDQQEDVGTSQGCFVRHSLRGVIEHVCSLGCTEKSADGGFKLHGCYRRERPENTRRSLLHRCCTTACVDSVSLPVHRCSVALNINIYI